MERSNEDLDLHARACRCFKWPLPLGRSVVSYPCSRPNRHLVTPIPARSSETAPITCGMHS
jgi:hypothetical protein